VLMEPLFVRLERRHVSDQIRFGVSDFGRNVSVSYVVGFGWHDLAVNQQPTDTNLHG
jgi:hypothetical protein